MAWAAFMDFLELKLSSDGFKKLRVAYPRWNFKTIEDLREEVSEYQIIEATRKVGLCEKNQTKALQGLLNKRNECAHPSNFYPGLNETLGYISEVFQRIRAIQPKKL
jgi:ribosomal protein S18